MDGSAHASHPVAPASRYDLPECSAQMDVVRITVVERDLISAASNAPSAGIRLDL
jgi:hypothetical protein